MNIHIIFLSFVLLLFNLTNVSFENTFAAAAFPKMMPSDVHMTYYENGGLTGSWKRIEIFEKSISIEVKEAGVKETRSWQTKITREESEAIFRAFVENKFNRLKNEKQGDVVYDASSETISIKAGKVDKSISFGENARLSNKNKVRFRNVYSAIETAVNKYIK